MAARERFPLSKRERRGRDDARIYLEMLKDYDRQILDASRSGSVEAWMLLIEERNGYVQANRHRGFRV